MKTKKGRGCEMMGQSKKSNRGAGNLAARAHATSRCQRWMPMETCCMALSFTALRRQTRAKKYRIPSITVGRYLPTNAADAPNCKPPRWLQEHLRAPEIALYPEVVEVGFMGWGGMGMWGHGD